MKHAIPILLALSLTACSGRSTLPVLPPLPAQVAAECQPLAPLTDRTLGAVSQALADTSLEYARCQAKHKAAVAAYNKAREVKQ